MLPLPTDTIVPGYVHVAANMEIFHELTYWVYFFDCPQDHPLFRKREYLFITDILLASLKLVFIFLSFPVYVILYVPYSFKSSAHSVSVICHIPQNSTHALVSTL